jgi:hypothetical protein
MSSKDGLPQQYNASMAYYKLGYAFHDPESSLEVRPGTCGYILENGSFHPIVNIDSAKATTKAGYKAIERTNLIKVRPNKRRWGPRLSITNMLASLPARQLFRLAFRWTQLEWLSST